MDREPLGFSEIEAGLERLMPRGLGNETRDQLHGLIDDLAAESPGKPLRKKAAFWQAAAAAVVLVGLTGAIASWKGSPRAEHALASLGASLDQPGLEVIEQKTWIDSGTDLGMLSHDETGEVSRGWSYSGVEEERLLHEDSGYEVILQRKFEAELHASSSL